MVNVSYCQILSPTDVCVLSKNINCTDIVILEKVFLTVIILYLFNLSLFKAQGEEVQGSYGTETIEKSIKSR